MENSLEISDTKSTDSKGSSLLLAIFILSILTIITFSLAKTILNELKMSSFVDYSLTSFYAAETGIENSLYEIRKLNKSLNNLTNNGSLNNKSSWQIDKKENPQQLGPFNLTENETIQIDLFDPGSPDASSEIEALEISWKDSWLEISWIEWEWDIDHIKWSQNLEKRKESAVNSPLILSDFSSGKMYRIRIKALFGSVSDLLIKACQDDNCLNYNKIKGRGLLESKGEFSKSRQKIKVEFPSVSSFLSGIWDYVLFSEESLVK